MIEDTEYHEREYQQLFEAMLRSMGTMKFHTDTILGVMATFVAAAITACPHDVRQQAFRCFMDELITEIANLERCQHQGTETLQ